MVDNTSDIAGNYAGGQRLTCILDEGAPTIVDSFDQMGLEAKSYTFATPLKEGDVVALSNDTGCTYALTKGNPVVERPVNGETLVIGRIVSTPKLQRMAANDAAANDLSERLAGDYFRTAVVEIWGGITKIIKANVMEDGTRVVVVGQSVILNINIIRGTALQELCFDCAVSGGTGVVAMNYCAAGTNGNTVSCLVGINGVMHSVTGA